MKEPNNFDEIVPGRPTAAELRAMALRQQQQIDSQHQLLAAKEQRLRFLKTQEARGAAAAAEGERLRRLRERVEAQESKLRRLRALRGQVDLQKTYNVTLSNDLDSIRALFSEKEKELSLAVAKVEALTRQLEELRRDRRGPLNLIPGSGNGGTVNGSNGSSGGNQQIAPSPAARELEKLRRELMYRNQLSLQQDARLHLQREALQQRQAELRSVDQRILELQTRLQRKKASNLLITTNNAATTTATTTTGATNISNKNNQNQSSGNGPQIILNSTNGNNNLSSSSSNSSNSSSLIPPSQLPKLQSSSNGQLRKTSNVYPQQRVIPRGNVAAIEPFNHSPQKITANPALHSSNNGVTKAPASQLIQDLAAMKLNQIQAPATINVNHVQAQPESDEAKLARQKLLSDVGDTDFGDFGGKKNDPKYQTLPYNTKFGLKPKLKANECDSEKAADIVGVANGGSGRTSIGISKSMAVPAPTTNHTTSDEEERPVIKPKMKNQIPSGNLIVPPRKPISSVAPTLAPKLSPKVHIVAPIVDSDKSSPRPALPPKPNKNQSTNDNASSQSSANTENVPPTIVSLISKLNHGDGPPHELSNQQDNLPIKARPLTIKKQPFHEQPKLKSFTSGIKPIQYTSRRIEMPPSFLFPEIERAELKDKSITSESSNNSSADETDKSAASSVNSDDVTAVKTPSPSENGEVVRRHRQSSLSDHNNKTKLARRVSFDPLALLLDASLEGELELVKKTAMQVTNPSAANDEGITALHNAICAGHIEIVKFLVEFGCDVNAQDSDGWTPLHCAASCNNLAMVKFLVESGACLFAATLSDHETPAEKCEEDEEGFDGCSEYLYSIQEKLGILNSGEVYAVFAYEAQQPDELSFSVNEQLTILRKGDDSEREWWWARDSTTKEGYVPRNLFGLYPRIPLQNQCD